MRLAGHLYRRAAFGGNWNQLQQALSDGPQATVDRLLRPAANVASFNRMQDAYEQAAAGGSEGGSGAAWWLRRLIESPHPLLEQMTLFWHNYFALSNARVKSASLMGRYVQLLRRQALGNFETLLTEMMSEPAVFAGLEARANRKARPSRYFARVLLEQYTLGAGNFPETAVEETARAFTGWFVSQQELRFIAREHQAGAKRGLPVTAPEGEPELTGELEGKAAVRALLRQPATAQLVVRKLYRWLISETDPPAEPLVAPLAADFATDFNIARLVETMLRSNLFFSPAAYRQKLKSPVEFALGIIRPLEGMVSTLRLEAEADGPGPGVYAPPTIEGWAGGRCWLNRFTLLGRAQLAQALLANAGPYGGNLDPAATARKHGRETPEATSRFFSELFLQDDLPDPARQILAEPESKAVPEPARRLAGLVRVNPRVSPGLNPNEICTRRSGAAMKRRSPL